MGVRLENGDEHDKILTFSNRELIFKKGSRLNYEARQHQFCHENSHFSQIYITKKHVINIISLIFDFKFYLSFNHH